MISFCQAYVDDILIYNKMPKKYYSHNYQDLECLQEARLQANMNKYEFHIKETKFFYFIVSTNII